MSDMVDEHQRQLSSLHDVHRQKIAALKSANSKSVDQLQNQLAALRASATGDGAAGMFIWLVVMLSSKATGVIKTFVFIFLCTGCRLVVVVLPVVQPSQVEGSTITTQRCVYGLQGPVLCTCDVSSLCPVYFSLQASLPFWSSTLAIQSSQACCRFEVAHIKCF